MEDLYANRQRRWFETIANYSPTGEFCSIFDAVAPAGWQLSKEVIWFVAIPPKKTHSDQGWKIHISTPTGDAGSVLRTALPVLFMAEVYFKFVADRWLTGEINGKLWPREASGKFITVYPNTERDFLHIGDSLSCALRDIVGPYILSDRRWPGSKSVYYRYGGFTNRTVLCVDGLRKHFILSADGTRAADERMPYWQLPHWAVDPHQRVETNSSTREMSLILKNGRYIVNSAITFSNRGGVYNAYDRLLGRQVILKEARPHVEIGLSQTDATVVVANEFSMLRELADTGYFPAPIDLFQEWEHLYLVEEHLAGETLGRFIIGRNPLYSGSVTRLSVRDYLKLMLSIWSKVAMAIGCAHKRGIVIGDLSVNNVIVTDQGVVKIIDLESAASRHAKSIGLFTPGFAKPSAWDTGIADPSNDVYAIGGVIFASLFLANNFIHYYPHALDRFLDELLIDMGLPPRLVGLVRLLMSENNLSADAVIEELGEIAREVDRPGGRVPRLAQGVDVRMAGRTKADLQEVVRSTVVDIIDYLNGTADLSRRDRLFPADMSVFSTSPVSVAYGASGVIYAINRITGEISPEFVEWTLQATVTNSECPPGLYLGKAGIAWVLDDIGYVDLALKLGAEISSHQLLWEAPGILYGAAGYGMLCARIWEKYHIQFYLDQAIRIGDWLSAGAIRDENGAHWTTGGKETQLGYAHGGSGIALFLLYLSLASRQRVYAQLGREALDFEVRQAGWFEGKFIGFPSETGGENSPYWISGTAGVLTTLLRYCVVYNDEKLKRQVGDFKGDLMYKYAKFPQLFMGLAGLGNCLLDLWQLLGDEKCLAYAWQTAEGILLHRIVRSEGVTFPGMGALRESGDFATGAAGVGLFLQRLLEAERTPRGRGCVNNFNFTVDELLQV